MERMKASDFPQDLLNLFDKYIPVSYTHLPGRWRIPHKLAVSGRECRGSQATAAQRGVDLPSIGGRIRDICAFYSCERGKFVRLYPGFAHDVLNGDAARPQSVSY